MVNTPILIKPFISKIKIEGFIIESLSLQSFQSKIIVYVLFSSDENIVFVVIDRNKYSFRHLKMVNDTSILMNKEVAM